MRSRALGAMTFLVAVAVAGQVQARHGDRNEDVPEDRAEVTVEFMAFADDSSLFGLKVLDTNRGNRFEVRDTKKNTVVKEYLFGEGEDKKVWRRVKRKHKLTQDPVPNGENLKKGITLIGNPKKGQLVLYVMKGDRIKPYATIPLRVVVKRKETTPAKASVKELVFDQRGRFFVVVIHQKLKGRWEMETDTVEAFRFKAYKAKFGSDGG